MNIGKPIQIIDEPEPVPMVKVIPPLKIPIPVPELVPAVVRR